MYALLYACLDLSNCSYAFSSGFVFVCANSNLIYLFINFSNILSTASKWKPCGRPNFTFESFFRIAGLRTLDALSLHRQNVPPPAFSWRSKLRNSPGPGYRILKNAQAPEVQICPCVVSAAPACLLHARILPSPRTARSLLVRPSLLLSVDGSVLFPSRVHISVSAKT